MTFHSKSLFLFFLILAFISTNNSFKANSFYEDDQDIPKKVNSGRNNFFKKFLEQKLHKKPLLTDKKKVNENQKEKSTKSPMINNQKEKSTKSPMTNNQKEKSTKSPMTNNQKLKKIESSIENLLSKINMLKEKSTKLPMTNNDQIIPSMKDDDDKKKRDINVPKIPSMKDDDIKKKDTNGPKIPSMKLDINENPNKSENMINVPLPEPVNPTKSENMINVPLPEPEQINNSKDNFENNQSKNLKTIENDIKKPLYIQDSFDNLFSTEQLSSKKLINVKCFYVNDFDIYSLEKLSTEKGYEVFDEVENNTALFSLCKDLKDKNTMFLLNGTIKAAGSIENYSKWEPTSNGLKITLPEGDECDGSEKYKVELFFECDNDDSADDEKQNFEENLNLTVNGCNIKVTSKTVYACPLNNYYIFERIFNKYKVPSVIFICLMGLFLVFFGAKVLKITVLLLGALIFTVVALSFIYSVFSISNENTMLIIMAVAFCIGLALGFLLLKLIKLFIILLGGACGYTLGLAVYAIIKDKDLNIEEDHLYYGTLIVCILLCAMISLCLVKHVLIFGTSIIGGYLIIKGISLILGHLPNESKIVDLIKNKEFDQLDEILKDDRALYYYAGWLLIIVIGVIVQYKNNNEKKKKNKLLK